MGEEKAEPKRRAASALTAAKVKTAGPGKYHDGGGLGLILRVDPNGSRFWVQRITIHGKRREIGLGSPPVVSLADARDVALENKKLLRSGGDPLAEKRKNKESITFAEACDRYMASKLAEFDNEKHRKQWPATLNTYAKPKIGNLLVRAITTADVLRVLEPIWNEKNETATRLRGRIEAVLSWATVAGHRAGDNPARWAGNLKELLPKPAKVAKADNQPALALGDVARWWTDLAKRDGMAVQALKFLALTAARSGEVRGMTWDEVTLDPVNPADPKRRTGLWVIPASRMKAGREHRVALTPEAVAILEALPRMEGSPFVFFAVRGGELSDMTLSGVMRRMQQVEEREGRPGYLDPKNKRPAVPHGLRSTFRQWAAERGYQRDMAELALAHFIGSDVERAYQRSDMLERRRAMMADWAAFLRGESVAENVVRIGLAG